MLEYAGCFWHGCLKCYSGDLENPQKHQTMGELEHLFLYKIRYLERAGYKVEVIWGHEFNDLKNDPLYQQHEDEILKSTVSPLKPRDAFSGGRTNACKLFAKVVKAGDGICYYDVCSLYPWVMKYCSYPVGHPEVILDNLKHASEYYGIIKCKVLPPRDLYHPVLPVKVYRKLMFPLCYTCAHNRIKECNHSEKQRCFEGTWVTLKVQKAVELGYKILDTYKVWHYKKQKQYDKEGGHDGVFSEYIKTLQGLKQEASIL